MCMCIYVIHVCYIYIYICIYILCVSSLRRGRANLHCIVPSLMDDPRRESENRTPCGGRESAFSKSESVFRA